MAYNVSTMEVMGYLRLKIEVDKRIVAAYRDVGDGDEGQREEYDPYAE